jgi:hypothetical protein
VVEDAALKKHAENDAKCTDFGWICTPLAVDSYGQWCIEAHKAFDSISSKLSLRKKISFNRALSFIHSSLGIVPVRQNALAILARRVDLPSNKVGARELMQSHVHSSSLFAFSSLSRLG